MVRPFYGDDPSGFATPGHSRAQRIVDRVMKLTPTELDDELKNITRSLDERHGDVDDMLRDRFKTVDGLDLDRGKVDDKQARLIGAYFSEEFSLESAALFNPSAVPHPDQSGVDEGDTRFILSLRGIGEGHVSSLIFRTGVWKADNAFEMDDVSPRAVGPRFDMPSLDGSKRTAELYFADDLDVSEEVVFPFLPSQGKGIEDCRLCQFTEEDGAVDYRGTFTAFDGSDTRQAVLRTADFKTFVLRAIDGDLSNSKGLAFFPRTIDGRYVALGRQDNENIWLVTTDDPHRWSGGERIIRPQFPWEFIQIGNCGSPIELDEGWLVITHGVGTVRNYCMGATLLDKADPRKVLARTPKPLLEPEDNDRDGYVPNVVYSCGSMLRGRTLMLPYGVADNFASIGTVDVDALLKAMS